MPPPASHDAQTTHGPWTVLAALAPLGVLDPQDGRVLAEHVQAGCAACEVELDAGWRAIDVLALATPPLAASAEGRKQLLATIAPPAPITIRRRGAPRGAWLLAAGIATVAATAGLVGLRQLASERESRGLLVQEKSVLEERQRELEQEKLDLEQAMSGLEDRASVLASRNAVLENAVEVAGGPEMKSIELSGESEFGEAHVRVLIDPALEQVVMLGQKLPAPPPGRTYQLWVVEDGQPSSLGTFQPDENGRALQLERGLLDWPSRRVFAVSVEPEGGVLKPSGPVVLSGS